jgi:hypothetical protein
MDILTIPEHLLDDAPTDDRPAQTLWAKFTHIEEPQPRRRVAILDSIVSEWFDDTRSPEPGWLTRSGADAGENTSILAVPATGLVRRQTWYQVRLGPGRVAAPIHAHEVDLGRDRAALQYDSMLNLPTPRPLIDLRPATRSEASRLGAAGSLSNDRDADIEVLEQLLKEVGEVTSAAVLDVGQGNWNALLRDGAPTLLFDLGGGVGAHLKTFPAGFTEFCFEERPPVVLSHWDWDHWSSAARFPQARELTWIVPRQGSLGPTHARFLAALRVEGNVLVYPAKAALGSATIQLQQAKGPTSSRNETGLAALVRKGPQAILFPADAGYGSLNLPKTLTSVVVPHHGGRSKGPKLSPPPCDGSSASRAVLSCARHNHYGHPTRASKLMHESWAGPGRLLQTCNRGPGEAAGHVELHWQSPAVPTPACCLHSALPLPQR